VTGLRVKERVLKGGHNIPEADQNRRFARTVRNFLIDYRHSVDAWILFDNSGLEPVPIAEQEQGETRIIKPEIYKVLLEQYGQPE
jgi:predicted ABC-type ATPase